MLWLIRASIPGPYRAFSVTAAFNQRSGIPSWHRDGLRIFGRTKPLSVGRPGGPLIGLKSRRADLHPVKPPFSALNKNPDKSLTLCHATFEEGTALHRDWCRRHEWAIAR